MRFFHFLRTIRWVIVSLLLMEGLHAADFDGDGLMDSWQIQYGFPTNGYDSTNLVAWWQMDQTTGTNVADRTTNSVTGTLSNFTAFPFVTGLYSNAISFSSNSFARFSTNSGILTLSNHFTISTWYNATNTTKRVDVATWRDTNGNSWIFGVQTNGLPRMVFNQIQNVQVTNVAFNVNNSTWHHLAGVYAKSNSVATVYVDGIPLAAATITNWNPKLVSSFLLGVTNNAVFLLDEARLYQSVISSNGMGQLPATYYDTDGDGFSNLQEMQKGTDPTDYYNGVLPVLSIISGNNQTGSTNLFLGSPLVVRVTTNGVALPNAPIRFAVAQGGAQLSSSSGGVASASLSVNTPGSGQVSAFLKMPAAPGTNLVTASAISGTNAAQVIFTAVAIPTLVNPTLSPAGGTYTNQVTVTLTHPVPGVAIRYTTDGSSPTTNSTLYTAPLIFTSSRILKVRAFANGTNPSAGVTATYTINQIAALPASGLKLWLKADAGVVTNGAGSVSQWTNQSTNINHATQAVVGAQPAYIASSFHGKPSIRFNGSSFLSAGTNASLAYTNFTFFLVSSFATASPGSAALLSKDEGGGPLNKWIYWYTGNGMQFHIQPGGAAVSSSAYTPVPNQFELLGLKKSGTSYVHYLNGATNGVVTDGTLIPSINSDLRIGQAEGALFFNGDLSEIMIYDRPLSESERQVVESSLATKYGWVKPVTIAPMGGTFNGPVAVTLTTSSNGSIRYTLDGSAPTAASTLYTGPFVISATSTLRTKIFASALSSTESGALFVINPFVDTDADGLADAWETQYFGSLGQTASGDYDGDGKTNLQEYQNGTNPTDRYNGSLNINRVGGDQQQGITNAVLDQALTVQLVTNSVAITNYPVVWSVTQGNGKVAVTNGGALFTTLTNRTDAYGQASVRMTLSTTISTNAVRAAISSGTFTTNVVFTEYANSGMPVTSGLRLWLKADAGIVTNASGQVSQWLDQSTNANHAIQADVAAQPKWISSGGPGMGPRPVIRFDGSSDYMNFNSLTNIRTVFWVIREDPAATPLWRFLLGDSTTYDFHGGAQHQLYQAADVSPFILNGQTRINGGMPIDGNTVDRPTSLSIISLVTTGPVRASNFSRQMNLDRYWWGDLGELLIYDVALSDTDRQSVETYLKNRHQIGLPPFVPANVSASAVSSTQIQVTWMDNSLNESGFKLERKLGAGGTYAQIALLGPNVSSFLDENLTSNATYFYRVRSTNSNGDSVYSNEGGATTFDPNLVVPSGLAAYPTATTKIQLLWGDLSSTETGFAVERRTGPSGSFSVVTNLSANVTAFENTGLTVSTLYTYRVKTLGAAGVSAYSDEASATTFAAATGAPTNLVATAISSAQVDLRWVDRSSDETLFVIERKTGTGGTYSPLAFANAGVTNYTDLSVWENTAYFYRVRARTPGGDTGNSNEASVTTTNPSPVAPSGLSARAISSTQIRVEWTDNASNEANFLVERKTGAAGSFVQIASLTTNTTSFVDTLLTVGTTYFYRIRASNPAGPSAYSSTVSDTPFVDTDNDGMPDAWETSNGLNPAVNDAAGDLDGDGTSNLNEYLTGRKPNKADSIDTNAILRLELHTPVE